MRLPPALSALAEELSTTFAGVLTPGQQRAMTGWVAGTILAGSACQTQVVAALVEGLAAGGEHAVRQQLRELLVDGDQRSAPGPLQMEVSACFAPLLGWVLRRSGAGPVVLALDVTTHTDQLTAIVVSVLTVGRALPVAWQILAGNQPGAFLEPTLALLSALAPAVPDRRVLLLADRGLWSPRLADHTAALGWQPLLRVQRHSSVWLRRGQRVRADHLVAGPGHAWVGRVVVHKDRARRRVQTLLVVWVAGHAEPWVLLTTGPLSDADLLAYGLRMWIAAGFRDLKRLGWQWERTRRREPVRAARHLLVLAVATLWCVAHARLPAEHPHAGSPPRSPALSAFRRGHLRLLAVLLGTRPAPVPALLLAPIPDPATAGLTITFGPADPPYFPAPRPPTVNLPL